MTYSVKQNRPEDNTRLLLRRAGTAGGGVDLLYMDRDGYIKVGASQGLSTVCVWFP